MVQIKVVNSDDISDSDTVSVTLYTGDQPDGKLVCKGSLSWSDVKPGATKTGSFTIENVGPTGSELDWEIKSWPSWGSWSFNKKSGTGLKDSISISVTVTAPDVKNTDYSGEIRVVNSDNSDNDDTVKVSLGTSRSRVVMQSFFAFYLINYLS